MVGTSYGGWAATWFAAQDPRIRCAVAGLVRGNLTVPGGGLNVASVGSRAWRRQHSPDEHTASLTGPVLVWNGGLDGDDADIIHRFVERARGHGKKVLWVRFPWEGHGLEDPAGREALAAIEDRFLGACLGGPAQGWPEEWADATMEVRGDRDLVPGLEAATRSR